MLRMSWLILETARPKSARLFCCFRVLCNSRWHARQVLTGDRQFVLALRRDQTRSDSTARPKTLHALGQPPDRENQHAIDGQEDQRRGDQRDDDRQEEDVARIDEHGRAQLGVLITSSIVASPSPSGP